MFTALLGVAAGLASLALLPALPSSSTLSALVLLAVLLCLSPWRSRLLPCTGLILGFVWACFSAQQALDDRLSTALDGRTLWLQGQVVGLPEVSAKVVRFELEQVQSRRYPLPTRLRLSWYGGPAVQAGEHWRLAVSLKRPRGLVNPHSFDYQAWLLSQRIGGTGSVKAGTQLSAASGPLYWRDALRQRLLKSSADGQGGALAALVVGDDSALTDEQWQVLQATGTVHLMVISGQHVSLLAGLLYAMVAGLFRLGLWPRALPWLPWACAIALVGALAYSLLAGFETPVRRACVMVAMVLLWRWRFRQLGVGWPLLVAFVLVLLAEPLAVLQPGFWLSFAAVAVLAWVFAARLGAWAWWQVAWRAQWCLALGLLPLFILIGLPISLSGVLANLLAVPWVGVAVVPLALLGTLLLPLPQVGAALLWAAGWLLEQLFAVLTWLAWQWPAWLAPALPTWAWLLGSLGLLLLLAPAGVPGRALGAVLALLLLFAERPRPEYAQAHIWQLDVGQGLSVLIKTRQHAVLYDAGPSYAGFDVGERVVLPTLRRLGIAQLDLLLLSHADNDHAGGAAALLRPLKPKRVLSGEAAALPSQLRAQDCQHGEHWQWDGVSFTTWRWQQASSSNAASCVLMVQAQGERMLLTGDIDLAAERALISQGLDLRADWLQVPHHGSRTSSSDEFLDAVAPRAALVSRSWHNSFGHPHPQVLARYRKRKIGWYDSAELGAIKVLLGGQQEATWWRQQRRFWREK